MNILKKMFDAKKNEGSEKSQSQPKLGDEFRKPIWFDDCETDDELFDSNRVFGFQIFTNPLEMQKHFEQQMQEMLKSLDQYEDTKTIIDENVRENYMKPGFENFLKQETGANKKSFDTDLDGEIYADQLHSLLQRISPEVEVMMPKFSSILKKKNALPTNAIKRSDEETIWDRIHGTCITDSQSQPQPKSKQAIKKAPPPRSGIFEGAFQGPKVFRQSIMTQTVRKPDGSYETHRVVRDANGNTNTTVTRTTADGNTETFSNFENGQQKQLPLTNGETVAIHSDRNIYVTKDGYAMPKNIW